MLAKVFPLRENSHILNKLTATGSRSDYNRVVTVDDRLTFKQKDNVENTANVHSVTTSLSLFTTSSYAF